MGHAIGRRQASRYGAGTLCGQAFKPVPLASRFMTPARSVGTGTRAPSTPRTQPPTGITRTRFGLIRFRSPLLTEYPFLQVLRCFTSLRTPRRSLRCRPMTAGGLPHSEILGSKPCWRLPEAYRILKRPSSVLSAKASTMRPCGRHSQRPCHPAAFLIARLPDDKSSHCSNDHKTIDLETKLRTESGEIAISKGKTKPLPLARVHYPVLKPPRATRSATRPTDAGHSAWASNRTTMETTVGWRSGNPKAHPYHSRTGQAHPSHRSLPHQHPHTGPWNRSTRMGHTPDTNRALNSP